MALAATLTASAGPTPAPRAPAPGPALVILVRHAEKATTPPDDPPLSSAGRARAAALADAVRDAGITAIVTSDRPRTQETAAPLAERRHLTPIVVRGGAGAEQHAASVAAAVLGAGGVVLVVDHSNTLPLIMRALGGPAVPAICDMEFSNLYLLERQDGGPAHLVYAHYGAPDPPHDANCAAAR
ncbi:MAG TPA: phosphoglycerate mutase family protein [Gemmatimonadales bacterium]|nr:phosphoglycerate mutase family protein [Gemmatimonadales bacterium]